MHNFKKYILKIIGLNKISRKNILEPQVYTSATTKRSMNTGCTLELSGTTEELRKKIDFELKNLMKDYFSNPEKLITYIKTQGITIYRFANADKLLKKLGEEEGFISPLKGMKALIINLIIGIIYENKIKIKLTTSPMLVFSTGSTEIYTIARALYKHKSYISNMPGYDYKSQELYKKSLRRKNQRKSTLSKYTIKEIFACKEAVARDIESIKYTLELSEEFDKYKKAMKAIAEKNSAQV